MFKQVIEPRDDILQNAPKIQLAKSDYKRSQS